MAERPVRGALAGARSDLIVYYATTWWDGPAGTDYQVATALREYGPVLYVDPPRSALARLRQPESAPAPLRVRDDRLAVLTTTVVPGLSRPGLHRLVGPMVRRAVRAAVADLYGGSGPVAAVLSSRLDDTWTGLPARRRLLYVTDDLPAGAELLGLPRERLLREEAAALRAADAVAVVSGTLRDRYATSGVAAELIPNGCSPEMYSTVDSAPAPEDLPALEGPVAGFLGHVNDRIDLSLLEAVADTGATLLIVGPLARGYQAAQRFLTMTGRPNVCWAGQRPYAQMPSFMRLIDVGLTPYGDTAFNRASFPLKTLEYLAAGRDVVATGLPATHWLATDLVRVADDPERFAVAVREALATPRTAELYRRRRAFAEQHSWRGRTASIAALLELRAPAVPST